MTNNASTAQPAASGVFPCDICGGQIETLRLIKWREYGQVVRYWVCLDCWKKTYPAEELQETGQRAVALAAISAIAASGDGIVGMIAITVIVIVVALVEYRR